MGFEPTRAEHIGLAVQRLNHSATSSLCLASSDLAFLTLAYIDLQFFTISLQMHTK